MENYIFYCYKEWLKKEDGDLFKQIFKLPVLARVLLGLLLAGLIVFFVILGFTIGGYYNTTLILIWSAIYFALCITINIYTENYQVKTSKKSLKNYQEYCDRMREEIIIENNISEEIIPKLIERYNVKVKEIDEKIVLRNSKLNKFMEMLLIPISVMILGAMLEKSANAEQTLGFGLSGVLIILFFYAIALFVLFVYDAIIRFPQVKYKQFITDMQSILDCCVNEYNTPAEGSEETTLERTNIH